MQATAADMDLPLESRDGVETPSDPLEYSRDEVPNTHRPRQP
jgi:hypothetical protein